MIHPTNPDDERELYEQQEYMQALVASAEEGVRAMRSLLDAKTKECAAERERRLELEAMVETLREKYLPSLDEKPFKSKSGFFADLMKGLKRG